MSELQQQLDELRARVDVLERERWTGSPRLGPKPPTDQETAATTERIRQAVEKALDPKGQVMCTTSGAPVDQVRAEQTEKTGQHQAYIVLCEEERRKGFVRPYRDSYQHVGVRPKYPTRELTAVEHECYDQLGYVSFEAYPADSEESNGGSSTGRYWTSQQLNSGCSTVTTMGRALSETYARDPKFYGATFCVKCNKHLPVAEFVWTADGQRVGS